MIRGRSRHMLADTRVTNLYTPNVAILSREFHLSLDSPGSETGLRYTESHAAGLLQERTTTGAQYVQSRDVNDCRGGRSLKRRHPLRPRASSPKASASRSQPL